MHSTKIIFKYNILSYLIKLSKDIIVTFYIIFVTTFHIVSSE